jgi:adenosylcobinamide-phosphate synthase
VAGLPGLLLYKITNTADSMIGYRTPRHEAFGWAAARFDDLLNLVPARGTAVLIAVTQGAWRDWRGIVADAGLHRSPNAGWPEAAMARALGIALSGPRAYDGRMQDFPFVHAAGRKPLMAQDIEAAVRVLWAVWAAVFCLAVALALL